MCTGIALALSELPLTFLDEHELWVRVHERGGEPEVWFLFGDVPRVLPVCHEGQLRLVRWGTRRDESRVLPPTGWTWQASVEGGGWGTAELHPVIIAATLAIENGIWFHACRGIRGFLVRDEAGLDVVYMLCEPASHYFQVMTRSDRMPVLVGERY
jgi:hypothetical protein